MRNYVIINGVNSNTINGLAINELPPITKPPMRVLQEEIDGRDGDITTNLGYGAYDKVMTIGLFHTFDINQIIAFFNGSGTIVFSNEPDKKYNYKIIDQIDYEKLISFKTATVTIHCQPFKYPLEEEPIEVTYTYVEGEGETLTLNNTSEALMKIDLKGNTSQASEPTPSNPVDVNVVTGDNTIKVEGKNLLKYQYPLGYSTTINGVTWTINQDGSITANGTANSTSIFTFSTDNEISSLIGKTIKFNGTPAGTDSEIYLGIYNTDWSALINVKASQDVSATITENATRVLARVGSGKTANNITFYPMFRLSTTTDDSYTPYQSQTYPIYLGVENLLKYPYRDTTKTENGITFTDIGDGTIKVNGTASANTYFYLTANNDDTYKKYNGKKLTISGCPSGGGNNTYQIGFYNDNFSVGTADNGNGGTFTGGDVRYNQAYIRINSGVQCDNLIFKPMLELGTKKNNYTPYGTTPIELCKIGDYQDRPFKAVNGDDFYDTLDSATKQTLTYGSWYIHKEIGKVVLDGSESWNVEQQTYYLRGFNGKSYNSFSADNPYAISTHFEWKGGQSNTFNSGAFWYTLAGTTLRLQKDENPNSTTLATFKTWLSTHNTEVYYVLATPTNTIISDTTLISQLDNLQNLNSYNPTTNIMQENNDKPFILKVVASAEDSGSVVIDNIGNIYSKPTIALEGNGTGGIYLNDNQILSVELTDKMTISISDMEAFDPDTHALLNRAVTGNYNSMTLQPNENTIKITGGITKATITDYTRWL